MEQPTSYCEAVSPLAATNVHRIYHDQAYGFPIADDNELFGRLLLEINQAGLSWTTILNKQENFRRAFAQFDIQTVAAYGQADRERLLSDAGIIRNRLKIEAAIHNARVTARLQEEFGSFNAWLEANHPRTKPEWTHLFKKTFRFTGGEIVNEFLVSTGYLEGAHIPACDTYKHVMAAKPAWTQR